MATQPLSASSIQRDSLEQPSHALVRAGNATMDRRHPLLDRLEATHSPAPLKSTCLFLLRLHWSGAFIAVISQSGRADEGADASNVRLQP